MARPLKPDGQKVTRHRPLTGGWQVLPAEGRTGPAPKLPTWRDWTAETRRWWRQLWTLPQATRWNPRGEDGLVRLALLRELMVTGKATGVVLSEIRHLEGLYGLNPRALVALRWRIEPTVTDDVEPRPVGRLEEHRRRMMRIQGADRPEDDPAS
jgi:hypothetical protein